MWGGRPIVLQGLKWTKYLNRQSFSCDKVHYHAMTFDNTYEKRAVRFSNKFFCDWNE